MLGNESAEPQQLVCRVSLHVIRPSCCVTVIEWMRWHSLEAPSWYVQRCNVLDTDIAGHERPDYSSEKGVEDGVMSYHIGALNLSGRGVVPLQPHGEDRAR